MSAVMSDSSTNNEQTFNEQFLLQMLRGVTTTNQQQQSTSTSSNNLLFQQLIATLAAAQQNPQTFLMSKRGDAESDVAEKPPPKTLKKSKPKKTDESVLRSQTVSQSHETELTEASIKSEIENAEEDLNSDLPSNKQETTTIMPKESEISERKRPAAIQELLQMKKARLNNTNEKPFFKKEIKDDEDGQETTLINGIDENTSNTACSTLKEIFQRLCNNQEDDAETTSSTHSTTSTQSIQNGAAENLIVALQQQHQFNNNNNNNNKFKKSIENGVYLTPTRVPFRANDKIHESPLSSLIPHDRIFAKVPGRLSLLSNVVKYIITVGEVKRRLMGPETFNFSLLGALLRRAKMPEKSQMLIGELEQVGLSIPRGRRRNTQITLLSALTEAEAIQFAKDFQKLAETEFPSRLIAELAVKRKITHSLNPQLTQQQKAANPPQQNGFFDKTQTVLNQQKEQITVALKMANEFLNLLAEDRSPVMDTNPEAIFDRNLQDPLSTYSMLTHGFGNPGILVGVQMFISFLNNQLTYINEKNSTKTTALLLNQVI